MISHIVLFRPAAPLTSSAENALLDQIAVVVRACPSVTACRVGRRVRHGRPGYEAGMPEDYPYLLQIDFRDLAGLLEYLSHPGHTTLGDAFARSSSLAYDYDLQIIDR